MKKVFAIMLAVLFLVPSLAMAGKTGGADYDTKCPFLRELLSHDHYIDDPRNPVEAYLGVEFHPTNKNWTLGGRVLCDVNNLDRDDRFIDNFRSEFGATYHFGPGL